MKSGQALERNENTRKRGGRVGAIPSPFATTGERSQSWLARIYCEYSSVAVAPSPASRSSATPSRTGRPFDFSRPLLVFIKCALHTLTYRLIRYIHSGKHQSSLPKTNSCILLGCAITEPMQGFVVWMQSLLGALGGVGGFGSGGLRK